MARSVRRLAMGLAGKGQWRPLLWIKQTCTKDTIEFMSVWWRIRLETKGGREGLYYFLNGGEKGVKIAGLGLGKVITMYKDRKQLDAHVVHVI
ncbi:hypothetical protein U9M48_004081 [Paspalum notatum var. saurae]|uniref:Uncharacterized protein n=1 Tax=Paspalum notatum var. saurae TaxID=547442 RepID=A0AAQ3PL16_PASNO